MPVDSKLKLFYYYIIHQLWHVHIHICTFGCVHVYMHWCIRICTQMQCDILHAYVKCALICLYIYSLYIAIYIQFLYIWFVHSFYTYIYMSTCVYMYVYACIHREREKEKEADRKIYLFLHLLRRLSNFPIDNHLTNITFNFQVVTTAVDVYSLASWLVIYYK